MIFIRNATTQSQVAKRHSRGFWGKVQRKLNNDLDVSSVINIRKNNVNGTSLIQIKPIVNLNKTKTDVQSGKIWMV